MDDGERVVELSREREERAPARPVVARPVVARPVVARPVVASPVVASPVVASNGSSDDEAWADKPGSADAALLPEVTRDDTDAGWGESRQGNDERLLAERPPHWG